MSRLKIRRHEQNYAELNLTAGRTYLLGRKEDSDVVLQPDPGISRSHIKIEFTEGYWTVQVMSQHIPITFEGKSLPVLVCKSPVTRFYVSPYHFELSAEDVSDSVAASEIEIHPKLLADESPATYSSEESIIVEPEAPAPPPPRDESPAIDPEVSFHGNEEATSDVFQGDEPYLKFMYATHSESIRLKGNKWVAGRDNIAQIHLDDKKASRQHFSIEKVGLAYFLKDLGSANGTLLNGQDLTPQEAREIKSGDIITVNQLTIIFELRDLAFSEKLKDLPLQVYSGPMILTSQEWDISAPPPAQLSTEKLAQLPGTVQKMAAPKNHLRIGLMALAAIIILGGVFYNSNDRTPASQDGQMKSFESLSIEDKKTVLDAYNAAQNFYKEGHFQNALNRLATIHKVIPFYKDSLELQTRLVEAQETLRQQEFIAQQRREQEKTRLKVADIVADCRDRFQDAVDVTAAKTCLNEALQLDPENSDAQSILAEIEMRMTQAQEAERRQKEYDDNVEKGRELFYKAKNAFQQQEYHEAISAFSAHLNSNLPDPDNLRLKSQRGIASIEKLIDARKGKYMKQAKTLLDSGNYKDAIANAQMARRVDPFDLDIANFIDQTTRDLESHMRKLYMDGTIEERFGNVELSKAKWQEIIKKDIPTGDYYMKSKRKLQEYGL